MKVDCNGKESGIFYFLKHLFLHVPLKTIEIISQNCENLKYGVTIKIPGQ